MNKSLIIVLALLMGCGTPQQDEQIEKETYEIGVVKEVYQTKRDTLHNVDTPALWHHPDGSVWLLATAKETDMILVYDALNGIKKTEFGGEGVAEGELDRPNAIMVIEDIAVIVERNNHRLQMFSLPDLMPLGTVGSEVMINPYGITSVKTDENSYRFFVTDNYETADEKIPPISELGKRVHEFRIDIDGPKKVSMKYIRAFGDTTEDGALRVVESLMADPFYDRLLIADEDSLQNHLKVYSLGGKYQGQKVGDGVFRYETEGIALYECGEDQGYWIATDQSQDNNLFHVFARQDLSHIGAFRLSNTTNTDGITLSQRPMDGFEAGMFVAVHNDGNLSSASLQEVMGSLGLPVCS